MDGHATSVTSPDGTVIHVDDEGAGPTVLLLHGLACDSSMWNDVKANLVTRHRVVVAELRGHGRSTPAVGGFELEQQADDIAAVLQTLDLHDVLLMGHSAGGYAALAFLVLRPELARERVRGAVTIGTSTSPQRLRERAVLRFSATRAFYAMVGVGAVGRLLVRWGAFGRRPSASLVERSRQMAVACPRSTKLGWVAAINRTELASALPTCATPLVFATGSRDSTVTASRTRKTAQLIGASVVIIPDVGHMAPLEAPVEIAGLIEANTA